MNTSSDSLYENDFYAWSLQQAELLRRLPAAGNEFDPEHIAEEIEDLRRSDLRGTVTLRAHNRTFSEARILRARGARRSPAR